MTMIEAGALALARFAHAGLIATGHRNEESPVPEPSAHQREIARVVVEGILASYHASKAPAAGPKLASSRNVGGGNVHETGPTALGGPPEVLREHAKLAGFTGHSCPSCGNFTMVQNGTCLKCMTCGSTTGCS